MKAKKVLFAILLISLFPIKIFAGFEVIGSLTYKYNAKKGETYFSNIKVRNIGIKDQEVRIYLRDYLFNYAGTSFYNDPGSHKRSNANWIKYSPKIILLKGKEIQNIQFEVDVPQDDSLTGTYWSVLMVEGVNPPDPNVNGHFRISNSVRYSIQIVTNIGKTGTGQLEFQKPAIVSEKDKKYFDFILLNTGEKLISPDVSIELLDSKTGKSVKVLKAPKNGMYPTCSTKWRFPLEGIPKGKTYHAVIVADGSGEDIFGLEYTIVL